MFSPARVEIHIDGHLKGWGRAQDSHEVEDIIAKLRDEYGPGKIVIKWDLGGSEKIEEREV